MATYSYSKLETFEQCRLKFKYKYLDKIIPEIPQTIESYFGTVIHKSLEWFYNQVIEGKIPTIDNLITFYSEEWSSGFSEDFLVVNKSVTAADYFNKGIGFLVDYYTKHSPFKDNTIATEKKLEINLDEKGERKLVGFVDRLVFNEGKNEIEIHDYKTTGAVLLKSRIEESRQLAIYSLAIKEIFGQDKNVSMVWHFLAQDAKFSLQKTNEELKKFRKELILFINEIESAKEFSPAKSKLCDWCEYKSICSAWIPENFKK